MKRRGVVWVLAAVASLGAACGSGRSPGPGPGVGPDPGPIPIVPQTVTFIGAGDIADCRPEGDNGRHGEETAKLLDKMVDGSTIVFTAGDNAYFTGTASEFANCYGPRWGRHRSRTRPSPGNHEYDSPGAAPYFQYFGERAGPSGLGYYSYDHGNWHIISLNSMVPMSAGQEQYVWLQDDLAAYKSTKCTLAYWHHPRFTSGPSLGGGFLDVWRLLYESGVDVVINGHDHGMERFEPQTFNGVSDPVGGIREFIVGSGGASLYGFQGNARNSGFTMSAYGVLKMTLRVDNYDWAFIEAVTERTLDSRSGALCH
jgi:hypothetical protein